MNIVCKSPVDRLELRVAARTTILELKQIISNVIGISHGNFRISFQGKLCSDRMFAEEVEEDDFGFREVAIEFNETEKARKQVNKHYKKLGLKVESEESLEKQLQTAQLELGLGSQLGGKGSKNKKALKNQAKKIDSALAKAYNEIPEFYIDSGLLFVEVKLNNVRVLAVIDTGAQHSVLHERCAQKCRLMRMVDRKFAGTADGMGTTAVLGKLNRVRFEIGNYKKGFDAFVLKQLSHDLIIGMDFLKKNSARIDIAGHCLILNGERIKFLDFCDLPERIET